VVYRAEDPRLEREVALKSLGDVALAQDDHDRVRALYEESLAIFRELGISAWIAVALLRLGSLECHQGNVDASAATPG